MLKKITHYLGVFLLIICLVIPWGIVGNTQELAPTYQEDISEIVVDIVETTGIADIDSWIKQVLAKYTNDVIPKLSKFLKDDNVYLIKGSLKLLNELLSDIQFKQYTECIEPNYIYQKASVNDRYFPLQWNLQKASPGINVEKAWAITKGQGVKVAVLDSGIEPSADFDLTEILPGYDFIEDREITDRNGFKEYADGHGTHIAGTIAQSTNNKIGVAGIAYEAALMPLRILENNGVATAENIAEAIEFAADNKADVINLSLAGTENSCVIKDAVDYAHNKGVVIVAAAGNDGINTPSYPAYYEHVIGVGAYDRSGSRTRYSNYGNNWVDIYAPGGLTSGDGCTGTSNSFYSGIVQMVSKNILGEKPISKLIACQGTSQAAAHVSGVVALVKSVLKQSPSHNSPDEVINIIQQTARRVDGIPLLDGGAAVELAWNIVNPPPPINQDLLIPVVVASGLIIWGIFGKYKFASGLLMTLVGGLWSLNQAILASNVLFQVVVILSLAVIPPLLIIFLIGHPQMRWLIYGTALGAVVVLAGAAFMPTLGLGLQIFSGICVFLISLLAIQIER